MFEYFFEPDAFAMFHCFVPFNVIQLINFCSGVFFQLQIILFLINYQRKLFIGKYQNISVLQILIFPYDSIYPQEINQFLCAYFFSHYFLKNIDNPITAKKHQNNTSTHDPSGCTKTLLSVFNNEPIKVYHTIIIFIQTIH